LFLSTADRLCAAATAPRVRPIVIDPDTHPRWERRKESRPSELLAAALEVFVGKGYAGTRLEEVAARAGVSKGTLYLYFQSKEELFKAVVRENIVRNIDEARAEIAGFQGNSEDLLRYVLREWWRRIGATPAAGLTKLMMAESGNFPDIAAFYLDEVIVPAHAMLASVVERGITRGEFEARDVGLTVQVMIAPVVMLLLWSHSFGLCSNVATDPQAFLELHIDTTLAGLRPRSRPANGEKIG